MIPPSTRDHCQISLADRHSEATTTPEQSDVSDVEDISESEKLDTEAMDVDTSDMVSD